MTTTANGPGAAVVVAVLSRVLTSASLLLRMAGADPRAAIAMPLRASDLPRDLAAVAWAAWGVAIGPDDKGPGVRVVIQALSRILTIAGLVHRDGDDPRAAISFALRWFDVPRGLKPVARAAWAFAVGFDDDGSDDGHERRSVGT